jgi:hypothetical protein
MNLLTILGIGGAIYAIFKPSGDKPTVDQLTSVALPIAQQHVANGVPPDQAAQLAAMSAMAQAGTLPPPPPLITYSTTPIKTTQTGPIISLSDPRIAQAVATAKSGGTFSAMASEISAVGMPLDVRNALIAQGWTWTGSVFNPGGLVPPGVAPMFVGA